ncbi:trans-aconitate 2-methyltransferase [Pseudoruegeria sp. HB172150]|uniref:class I SAM-dependent methyltransferase n=1 Tax=Pseudoruegeria sp. HB172150 TaxID=2721164 RepID=UPI0015516F8E|nr:class I SAM-dependent methyltransferase [Pseudoruegeria sp. HB172150]
MRDAFYELYAGLDREGPGEPEDVIWAAGVAGLGPEARICDAGSGSGGDIPALLAVAPEGHVTAVDKHKGFVDEVLARFGTDRRVTAYKGDIAKLKGPYDFIWSAGAVYFLGVPRALNCWRPVLAKGGAVAFSEPCFFVEEPSEAARLFWDDYPTMDEAGIAMQIESAGYEVLGTRRIADAAWERYYQPLKARIALLRDGAEPVMTAVLDATDTEIATWRTVKEETGYLMSVVRPA